MDADSSYGGSDTAQDSTLGHDSNSLETSISNHTNTVHNHHDEVDKSVMPSNDTSTYFKNEVTLPINYDDKNQEKSSLPHYLSTAKLNIEDDNSDNLTDSKNYSSTHHLNEETPKPRKKPTNNGIDNPAFQADEKSNHQPSNGALKSTFDENKAFTNGDLNSTPLGFTSPTKNDEQMAEAVNLELINLKPTGKDVGGYDGTNGINDIPIKKETEVEIGNPYDEYFVPVNEHRKYMRGEKLYVTKDKRDKKKRNKCLCWSLCLVLVAAAVIVGILAAVGIIGTQEAHPVQEARHFSDSPKLEESEVKTAGGIFGLSDKNKNPYPHTPEPPISTIKSVPTTDTSRIEVPRALESEILIDNLHFYDALSDKNSTEFKDLAEHLEHLLKNAIFPNDMLMYEPTKVEVKVMEFMPGSVRTKFRVGWTFDSSYDSEDPIDRDSLKQRLSHALQENYGYLEEYHIPEATITSEKIINMCQIQNNDCEHSCVFNYKILNFMCECPFNQQLDVDEKSCVEISKNHYHTDHETVTDFEFEKHGSEEGRSNDSDFYPSAEPESTSKLITKPTAITEPTPEPTSKPEPEPTISEEVEHSVEFVSKPEPTSKPEPEPEPTSNPEPTSKPEPEPEPTTIPKPKPTTKSQLESAFEHEYQAAIIPEPEPTSEPEPEPTSEPEPEPTSEPDPEPTSKAEPAATAKPEPEPTSTPEPGPTSKPEPVPSSKPELEPTSQPEPEPTSYPEPEPASKPEPEPTSEPEPEPTSKIDPELTSKPEPEPTSKPEPEPKPQLKYTLQPEPEPTFEPKPEPTLQDESTEERDVYEVHALSKQNATESSITSSTYQTTNSFSISKNSTTIEPVTEYPINLEPKFEVDSETLIHSQEESTTHLHSTEHMQMEVKPTITYVTTTFTSKEFKPEIHTSASNEFNTTQKHDQTESIPEVTIHSHSTSTHSQIMVLSETTMHSTDKKEEHNTILEESNTIRKTNSTLLETNPMTEKNTESTNKTLVHEIEVHITTTPDNFENQAQPYNNSGREAKLSDDDKLSDINRSTIETYKEFLTTTIKPTDVEFVNKNVESTNKPEMTTIFETVSKSASNEIHKPILNDNKIIHDVIDKFETTTLSTISKYDEQNYEEATDNKTSYTTTTNKVKEATENFITTTPNNNLPFIPVVVNKNNRTTNLTDDNSTENVIENQSHDSAENVENMSPYLPDFDHDTIVKTLNAEIDHSTDWPYDSNKTEMYVITENPPRLDNDEMNVTNPFDPNPTDTVLGVLPLDKNNSNQTVKTNSSIVVETKDNNKSKDPIGVFLSSTTSSTSKRPSLSPDIINNVHSNNLFFKLHTSTESSESYTEPIQIKSDVSKPLEKDLSTEDLLALETTTFKQNNNVKNTSTIKEETKVSTKMVDKKLDAELKLSQTENINAINLITTTMNPFSGETHQYEVHEQLSEDITTPSLLALQKTYRSSNQPLAVIPLSEERQEKKRAHDDAYNKLDNYETIYDPRDFINDINDENHFLDITSTELPKDSNSILDDENIVTKLDNDQEDDHYLATDFTDKYTFTTPSPINSSTGEDFYIEQIKKANISKEDVKPVTEGFSFNHFSRCPTGQFQCLNGTSVNSGTYCIPNSDRCDSVDDCTDASDEIGCAQDKCLNNFQCNNGQCLKRHLVCNGISDCLDGSDETGCQQWTCRFDEFSCGNGSQCIPLSMKCDGRNDCPRAEDEYQCFIQTCQHDSYHCLTQETCIPSSWKCDGKTDCNGGDDENLCECDDNEFKCMTGGGCIPNDEKCDGIQQCPDLSDEWNCLRLQEPESSTIHTNYIEVQTMNSTWLPLCSDSWNNVYSDVVCQNLGFTGASATEFIKIDNSTLNYFRLKDNPIEEESLLTQLEITSKCESVVSLTCQEFECGSQASLDVQSARIIGGSRATETQWPSVTFLYDSKQHKQCTSTLIAPSWAIASYSCIFGKEPMFAGTNFEWSLYAGGTNFSVNSDNSSTQIRSVKHIIPHPQAKFKEFVYVNDIVLIELITPLNLGPNVSAICLPNNEIEPRQLCVTAGWGVNQPGETNRHQYLNYLPVPTIDVDNCNSSDHYNGRLTADKICAGYTDSDKTPCYNDEGAPLMCFSDVSNTWELRGLLSYHANCGRSRHPALYSSINKDTRQWISHTIGLQLMMNQRVALNKK